MAREVAVLGGGCFWCLEAVFLRVRGVESVRSGYCGGDPASANYREVCSGRTRHAEVVEIVFDSTIVTFSDLLDVFFVIHDPTTRDRQGADVGPQYRSVVFARTAEQADAARSAVSTRESSRTFGAPIVTEVVDPPGPLFHVAEAYHQDYFALNPMQPYCRAVVDPKVRKFLTTFPDRAVR